MTFCSHHFHNSNVFKKNTMIGVNFIYKLLDCIQNAPNKICKTRLINALHFLLQHNDCDDELMTQIVKRISQSRSIYHVYQLIVWNNFIDIVSHAGDKSSTKQEQYIPTPIKQIANASQNVVDVSVVSLVYIDYMIEREIGAKQQRSIPLETKVVETLTQQSSHVLDTMTEEIKDAREDNEVFAATARAERNHGDSFDKLCNILAVFGNDCGRAIVNNRDLIGELFKFYVYVDPFHAVFDLFDRLKIYDIYPSKKVNSDSKEDEKESTRNSNRYESELRQFFVECFGKYVKLIKKQESKNRLYKLLTDYKHFITHSRKETKNKFYTNMTENRQLRLDARFVPAIKHVIKKDYNDNKLQEWFKEYWDKHGVKAVVDIIYKCDFNFTLFCNVLKEDPQRLRNDHICKFDEWLELVGCINIPESIRKQVCSNPPLSFKDIINMKDEETKTLYLEKLKLISVEDDPKRCQTLGFAEGLLIPLIKFEKYVLCNTLLKHLIDNVIPDIRGYEQGGIDQDKKLISFFASSVGQQVIRFLNHELAVEFFGSCVWILILCTSTTEKFGFYFFFC